MMEPRKWSWSLPQRRALIAFIALGAVCLIVDGYLHPVFVGEVLPAIGPRAGELADRLDPNTATIDELSTIPQLGPARARALIAYRQSFIAAHPGHLAFLRPDDLRNIKGIGPGIEQKLSPYLDFEGASGRSSP